MQQPNNWIWGLFPLAVVWLLAGMVQTDKIEQDLNVRSTAVAASKGVLAPEISAKGRDVTIAGTRLFDNRADLIKAIEAENGVRLVRDETRLVAEAKPYMWSFVRDGATMTLGGHVPDPTLRSTLRNAVVRIFSGATVSDQMTYARGASGDLGPLAEAALGVVAPLTKGRIDIVDGKVSISGEAATVSAYDAAVAALKSVPVAALDKAEILPRLASPYTFEAQKNPNQIVLSGFYPDEKAHQDWLAQARSHFFGTDIVDKLELARGAPPDLSLAVKLGLGQLSRLETGTLSVAGEKVGLKGVTLFERAAQQITSALASGLPSAFSTENDLTVKQALASRLDASACQSQLVETSARGRILFDTGEARIAETSYGLLDALVFIANNCSVQHIVVTGHTDSVGQADANLDLSKRRAQAVADYLTGAGIATDRIEVVGLGQTKPIASNDTEEGRALNRRIEFTVE